jgi:hypothetical protein
MNNSVNATTLFTLNELVYDSSLCLFFIVTPKFTVFAVIDFMTQIQQSMSIVKDYHVFAKTRQSTQSNLSRQKKPEYKVEDQVYLNTVKLRLEIKQKSQSTKLYPRYIGSFKILSAISQTSIYKLDLSTQYKIHLIFHARRLKSFTFNDLNLFSDREPSRPAMLYSDEEEEVYEVESIVDHEVLRSDKKKYLVHWLEYFNNDDE